MARKPEQDDSAVIKALEELMQRLSATNELLLNLAQRMPMGERLWMQGAVPAVADLRPAPAAGVAAAPEDENILRDLARPHALEAAVERLIVLRNEKHPDSRPRYWGIVNFDLHSAKPRLFVFDVISQTTSSYFCAHGRGSEGPSDDGFANVFSNTPGSEASSLGIYRCDDTYDSDDNGYSLRLDGLETTNSNARSRLIVMHGAWYVSEEFAKKNGRIGRSQGCPALDHMHARTVIDQLKRGSLLLLCRTG